MEGMTQNELNDMLKGIAWHWGRITEEWGRDLQERPKLSSISVREWTLNQLCMCAQQGAQVNPGQVERVHCSV